MCACVKEGEVKGESRALLSSEETLIISCEVRNAGRALNRSSLVGLEEDDERCR